MLERRSVADDHAALRASTSAYDDRRRRRQTQRARTRNHQDRDRIDQRARRIAVDPPRCCESHGRNCYDDRHENACDTVGETLNRRLGSLRITHEPHDAGEQRRFADACGDTAEEAFIVDGARVQRFAGPFGHRRTLTGQHAFVDRRVACRHGRVDRDGIAGAHDNAVAGTDARQRYFDDVAIAFDECGVRLQLEKTPERGRRTGFGARFEQFAEQHQRDHPGGCFKIDMLVRETEQRNGRTQEPGHRSAERNQHVHVGAAAAQ